jgi:hypothetical protein
MKPIATVFIVCAFIQVAMFSAAADTIILRNGTRIDSEKCWEQDDLIKCKRYGATVGYQKGDIAEIIQISKQEETPKMGVAEVIDMYRVEITHKISEVWSYNRNESTDAKSECSMVLKVLPDGSVEDVYIVTKSNDELLNQSAYSAIKKPPPCLHIHRGSQFLMWSLG